MAFAACIIKHVTQADLAWDPNPQLTARHVPRQDSSHLSVISLGDTSKSQIASVQNNCFGQFFEHIAESAGGEIFTIFLPHRICLLTTQGTWRSSYSRKLGVCTFNMFATGSEANGPGASI